MRSSILGKPGRSPGLVAISPIDSAFDHVETLEETSDDTDAGKPEFWNELTDSFKYRGCYGPPLKVKVGCPRVSNGGDEIHERIEYFFPF